MRWWSTSIPWRGERAADGAVGENFTGRRRIDPHAAYNASMAVVGAPVVSPDACCRR